MSETRIPLTDEDISLLKELLQAETHRRSDVTPLRALLVKLRAYDETLEGKSAREVADMLVRRGVVKDVTGLKGGLEIVRSDIREDPFDFGS